MFYGVRDGISRQGRAVFMIIRESAKRIQNTSYDLIIADLVMPGLSGLDLLKYAKEVNPDVIVIIITGYASVETAMTAIREGAYDYISKPCKLEEVKVVVETP